MTITHQDIADRTEALGTQQSAAYKAELARIARERESLQELCGGIGHVFVRTVWSPSDCRQCAFCHKREG